MRSRIPFSDQRDSSVVCLWFYLVFDSLAATTIAASTWTLSGGGDDDGRRKARFRAFFANWISLMQIFACEQWGHCFVRRMTSLALGCKNDDRG